MRDCANCFHRKPVLKEDGTWTAECEKWDCEFQSRENMIEKTKAMNNDLISREQIRKMLNEAFGCENATKYGNENAEQQAKSYSTLMLYEIADIVEDCCDNAPTVKPCDNCDLYFKATTKEIDRWYKKEDQKGGADMRGEEK